MSFRDLVENVAVPTTRVAEHAWDLAEARVRRRRVAVGASLAAAVLVAIASVARVQSVTAPEPALPQRTSAPSSSTGTPTTVRPRSTAPTVSPGITMPRLDPSRVGVGNPVVSPSALAPTRLSEDPVSRARLAISDPADQTRVLVLGDDSRWRVVDVPLRPCIHATPEEPAPVLTPMALSPDATSLALPQPHGLVVVDLTTGASRSFAAGGRHNVHAVWVDEASVLVAEEGAGTGTMVALATGVATPSPYGPSAAFAGDGRVLQWGGPGPISEKPTPMQWSDGHTVPTLMNNLAGRFTLPPLVSDDVVVGLNVPIRPDVGLDNTNGLENGLAVVDRETGAPLAYQPTSRGKGDSTQLLGWQGDRVVYAVSPPFHGLPELDGVVVLSWAWDGRAVERIVRFPPGTRVAWGFGAVAGPW